jgi:hypothetical protein
MENTTLKKDLFLDGFPFINPEYPTWVYQYHCVEGYDQVAFWSLAGEKGINISGIRNIDEDGFIFIDRTDKVLFKNYKLL